jgi:peptidoglycan/xylan/chitin deacetylase (PgdA/CDA1 family)
MVQVFLTFDTESSLGGAWENPNYQPIRPWQSILGKIGSDYYGIPRIMDILEANGLRGTFFVEVFAALNGFRQDFATAYSDIVRRGHDAQLHLHPVHYYYNLVKEGRLRREQLPPAKDMIGALPPDTQLEMLRRGVSLFQDLVGNTPVAFRAGNFGANSSTLDVLDDIGIRIDSSFNASYLSAGCMLDSDGTVNAARRHGNVLEIPLTNYETGALGLRRLKQLSINAVSLLEMTGVLEQADRIGLRFVNFIGHSFSLFKIRDVQFLSLRPDRLVIHRFQGLCRFLRENAGRFPVVRFCDIEPSSLQSQEKAIPRMGLIVPSLRKLVQAVNRLYWI